MSRFIEHSDGSPAWNMAVDETLLRLCRVPVLRCYSWEVPAVSIGYFQKMEIVPTHRPWVRRLTGGGLVDHAADFTYTVALPVYHSLSQSGTVESYRLLHQAVSAALSRIGIDNQLAPCCADINSPACFQKAVKFDVVTLNGQKLAGAAQRRAKTGVLHQGSIALRSELRKEFTAALVSEIALLLESPLTVSELSEEEYQLSTELTQRRYSLDSWNRLR